MNEEFELITSAEREVKVSRHSGMYQSYNFLTRLDMQSLQVFGFIWLFDKVRAELIRDISILVTTPQYQPPTKVCVANRLISEKMISCIFLILFVLGLFSLFAGQFLRFRPFNISKSFFEIRMRPLVHWLPKSSFPVVGFQLGCFNTRNHRATGNRMIRKARNKYVSCSSRIHIHDQAQFSYYINKIILFFVLPQGPEEMCLSLEHQNPSK